MEPCLEAGAGPQSRTVNSAIMIAWEGPGIKEQGWSPCGPSSDQALVPKFLFTGWGIPYQKIGTIQTTKIC